MLSKFHSEVDIPYVNLMKEKIDVGSASAFVRELFASVDEEHLQRDLLVTVTVTGGRVGHACAPEPNPNRFETFFTDSSLN